MITGKVQSSAVPNADPAGPCPFGGQEIFLGLDLNENGEIDEDTDEVTSQETVCNGAAGTNAAGTGSAGTNAAGTWSVLR